MDMPDSPLSPAAADASPFTPGLAVRLQHSDLDEIVELARASDWPCEVMRIGRGPFRGSAKLVETQHLQAYASESEPGLMVRGASPPHATNFSIVSKGGGNTWEDGLVVEGTDITVGAGGSAFDARSFGQHRRLAVSVADAYLSGYANAVLDMHLDSLAHIGRLRIADAATAQAVSGALEDLVDWAVRSPGLLAEPQVGQILTDTILDTMLLHTVPAAAHPGWMDTYRVARRVEEFIRENAGEPLSIRQICQYAGLPERTLFHVFRKHFGQSPKAYLMMARLNGAHGDLRRPASDATVTDVATRWGFFHFGRFATYYREAFGEPPSATLRRFAPVTAGPR